MGKCTAQKQASSNLIFISLTAPHQNKTKQLVIIG
jgi:hypothetical protein